MGLTIKNNILYQFIDDERKFVQTQIVRRAAGNFGINKTETLI